MQARQRRLRGSGSFDRSRQYVAMQCGAPHAPATRCCCRWSSGGSCPRGRSQKWMRSGNKSSNRVAPHAVLGTGSPCGRSRWVGGEKRCRHWWQTRSPSDRLACVLHRARRECGQRWRAERGQRRVPLHGSHARGGITSSPVSASIATPRPRRAAATAWAGRTARRASRRAGRSSARGRPVGRRETGATADPSPASRPSC